MNAVTRGRFALGAAAATLPRAAFAADSSAPPYPIRPITVVTWVTPGSASDLAAREIARFAPKYLHANMVVENKTGGDGANTLAYVLSQPADGYTLLLATRTLETTLTTDLKGSFKLSDFVFLMSLETDPFVFAVSADSPYRTLADVVAAGKTTQLAVATFGNQSIEAQFVRRFARTAKTNLQVVPFPGGAAAIAAALGGHVPLVAQHFSDLYSYIDGGKLRGLAISTVAPSPMLPAIATFGQLGYADFVFANWRGLAGRADLPATVVSRISDFGRSLSTDPDYVATIAQRHLTLDYNSAATMKTLLAKETAALSAP